MKTLVIVSHPEKESSHAQSFFYDSLKNLKQVTYHWIDDKQPLSIADEQELLLSHDRVIFQFPMYWYSAPSSLKYWLDSVLTESIYKDRLKGKELGLVVTLGVKENRFQAGASEQFTLSEIFRPFEAIARKCQMIFLPIFSVSQFGYLNNLSQKKLLIDYQQYLTMPYSQRLEMKEKWFQQRLSQMIETESDETTRQQLVLIKEELSDNRLHLDDLNFTLDEMRDIE